MNLLAQVTKPATQVIDLESRTLEVSPIQTFGNLIEIGARAALTVGALAVLVFFFLGALKWVTSGGDKGKVEEARSTLTQAAIGLVVLASVFAIYAIVLNFFGLGDRIQLNIFGKTFSSRQQVPATGTGGLQNLPTPIMGGKF